MAPHWLETYLGLIYQVYGLSFFVLGVVAFLLPKRHRVLPFAPHLFFLGLFGTLHGLLEFVSGERLHNSAAWLDVSGLVLLVTSYAALLEFGRRTWNSSTNNYKLPGPVIYAAICLAVAGITFLTKDSRTGLEIGMRYLVGSPGAIISGVAIIFMPYASRSPHSRDIFNPWQYIAGSSLILYGVLTLFVSANDAASLPAWLLTNGGFYDNTGLPVQLARTFCAAMAAMSFTILVHRAGSYTEEQLVFHSMNLEKMVGERTIKLDDARKYAEKCNAAKSQFLSSMSHELRTPMNAIIGFSQLLKFDEDLNDQQQDNVDEILNASHHLLDLINDILDLSKIEAGHINLSLESLELSPLVKECLSLTSPLADRHHIEITQEIPEGILVNADRTRLKQALVNLISNAVKYNVKNGSVTICTCPKDDDWIKIQIKDTGHGIHEDKIDELFKPFSRLGAESSEIEGAGIGLTITQQIIQAMKGEIYVESEVGKGSTFTLVIPLEKNTVIADGGLEEALAYSD